MATKRSAGILLHRRRDSAHEVLLVHPGGPFWAKKDAGAWSITARASRGRCRARTCDLPLVRRALWPAELTAPGRERPQRSATMRGMAELTARAHRRPRARRGAGGLTAAVRHNRCMDRSVL